MINEGFVYWGFVFVSITSTSFTPQPPFPFLSRHALIQPIKTCPSTQQCKHDSSYHTPSPHSGYFTSAKRRIPQELQTSFKNKHISLLTNHHPFQPKYSSRVSTLSQHLQSPHTTRTALTQPTSFLKEDPPPFSFFLIKVTSYAPWGPHSPFAFQPLSFCATNIWHTKPGGLGYKQWMY